MTERKSYATLSIEAWLAERISKEAVKNKITVTEQIKRAFDLADIMKNGVN